MAKSNLEIKTNLMRAFKIENDDVEFKRLCTEGIIVKDTQGKYSIGQSIANYIKYLKDRQGLQEVTARELADIFGYAQVQSVQDLANKSIVIRLRKGIYDANQSSQNYIQYLKGNNNPDELESLQELQYRKELAKAKKEEEELRKIKRLNDIDEAKIIPTDVLIEFFGPMSGQISRALDNIVVEFRKEFEDDFNQSINDKIVDITDRCKSSITRAHLDVLNEINKIKDELDLIDSKKNSTQIERHEPGLTQPPEFD